MNSEINNKLKFLHETLLEEKEYDLLQYKEKFLSKSIPELRNSGLCWYPVSISESDYDSDERIRIIISRPTEHLHNHNFKNGSLVNVFTINGKEKLELSGIVNFVKNEKMSISLNSDDTPEWLIHSKIGVELLFDEKSYLEMEYAIQKLIDTDNKNTIRLKNIILGEKEASFFENYKINLPYLNESQNDALNLTLNAQDIAIIHGPPGTGKTTTLIQAIAHKLKKEKQVLVTAPSNAAVDLLVEKLSEKNISVVRLGHPSRITEQVLDKTMDAKISEHSQYKNLKLLRKQTQDFFKKAKKYKRNFGESERQQRRELYAEAKIVKNEAKKLSAFIKEDILAETQVVACTLVGSSNNLLKHRQFTSVFIDEAAQALEPATWIPILKSEKVIFAGDHKQLPPTVKSPKAIKRGFATSLFEKAIENNNADTLLNTQYRMNEQIMQYSNNYFYENKLFADDSVAMHKIFESDTALEFIDTSGCGFFEQTEEETRSTFNIEEAEMLFTHLIIYINKILENCDEDDAVSVGIIAPYKAQINLLKEKFEEKNESFKNFKHHIAINTVDSFQGQERDVIYISLTRSNDKQEIGFLSDLRRMNVAMTRARKKLVIIGDSSTISKNKFYEKLVEYATNIGSYKSAFEYM